MMNLQHLDVDDIEAAERLRKRKRLVTIVTSIVLLFVVLLEARRNCSGVPLNLKPLPRDMITEVSDIIDEDAAARILEQSLWARIIALDQYSVDATRKFEQQFWDVYRGCEDIWYKEYCMSKENFNAIVRDTVPYLYSRLTLSLNLDRFRYLRAKVVMATQIRYLAILSDQHTLGKEFRVRQSCISKRIDRRCRALLSAYYYEGYPNPKISFSLEGDPRAACNSFFDKFDILF